METPRLIPARAAYTALLAGFVAGAFVPEAVRAQEPRPIIDMHLHGSSYAGFLPPEEPLTGLMAPDTDEEIRERTLSALERHDVVLAVRDPR